MKKHHLFLLAALFFASSQAFSTNSPLELKVKDDILLAEMKTGKTMLLPEFEMFSATGARIFHSTGFDKEFTTRIQDALSAKNSDGVKLSDRLPQLLDRNGISPRSSDMKDAGYVFIEYWAEWCSACLLQMKTVDTFISEHSDLKILWLKVEKDPTKLPSLKFTSGREAVN